MTASLPADSPLTDPTGDTIPVFSRWFGSWRVSIQRRPFSAQELSSAYDHVADDWSQKIERMGFTGAYEEFLRHTIGHAGIAPSVRVLDCGVGTGALIRAYARAHDGPCTFDGIDISRQMLDRAASGLSAEGIEAAFHEADAQTLPFADETFDVVMSAHMLEHLPAPDLAVREMTRVLRPGGLMAVCLTRRSILGAYVHLRWRTHRTSPAQAKTWFTDAGLEDVSVIGFRPRSLCDRLSFGCVGRKPGHAPVCASYT